MEIKRVEEKQVEALAEAAAKMWFEKNKDNIPELVDNLMNRKIEKIIGGMLGFEVNCANEWSISQNNARNGELVAANWIQLRVGEAVNEWLDKQAGKLPGLSESAISALRDRFFDLYKKRVEGEMRRLAEWRAVEFARDTVQRALEKL